jgi:V-type H+-transporting ATPase subunit a
MNTNDSSLNTDLTRLKEVNAILQKARIFFNEAESFAATTVAAPANPNRPTIPNVSGDLAQSLLPREGAGVALSFTSGVISRSSLPAFERVLWRASRGNVFLRHAEIDEPMHDAATGAAISKSVFIAFYQGVQLETKVARICDGFNATIYPCPDTAEKRAEALEKVTANIRELESVLAKTQFHRRRVLQRVSQHLEHWTDTVRRVKLVFFTMNLFKLDDTRRNLLGEAWVPANDMDTVRSTVAQVSNFGGDSGIPGAVLHVVPTKRKPPTFHRTNKFTKGFQSIVDAYGVASYREVNPGLFTIITFPFLFAVMFGDIGHGILMALFALFLVVREAKLANFQGGEIWNTMFGGRYIIFLMGIFSIYTGLIYNDMFSKSLNTFGSGWLYPNTNLTCTNVDSEETISFNANSVNCVANSEMGCYRGEPYPFGLDPMWALAENKLVFINSYKMKTAIVIGVIHMTFGVFMSLVNQLHFKRYLDIFTMFIPEVIFLWAIFGYLVSMIFYKWAQPWYSIGRPAPSLLLTLINMFLKIGSVAEEDKLLEDAGFQGTLQVALVLIAVFCVPWMLLVKPIIVQRRMKAEQYRKMASVCLCVCVCARVFVCFCVTTTMTTTTMMLILMWARVRRRG